MPASWVDKASFSFSNLRILKLKSSISSFLWDRSLILLLAFSRSSVSLAILSSASFLRSCSRVYFTLVHLSSFSLRANATFSLLLFSSVLAVSILALCRSTSLFLMSMRYLIQKSSAVLSLNLTRLSSSCSRQMSCSILTTLRSQYSMSLSGTSIIRYPIIIIIILTTMIRIISIVHPSLRLGGYTYSQLTNYTRRGRHRPEVTLALGDSIDSFRLKGKDYYRDFDITHLELQHELGTKLHHFECAQENNTLSMIFRTPNAAKKGINLALQKLLQCGSRKYAVRDLANHASNRSFSKLSPIQTTDEYLMFSFNTPILKDFSNLFNVYSSMLFNPLLRREDFYEVVRRFTYSNDRLGFTGDLAAQLFDGQFQIDQTIYSLISEELLGIDKQTFCRSLDLTQLSYDDIVEHYKKTVTLSNCTFVLHGDMNPQYFTSEFAKNVEEFKPPAAVFHSPPAIAEKVNLPKTINFEHLRQESIMMLSFRIDNATDEQTTLLEILSYLLFDMPESPFMRFNSPQTPYPPLYGFRQRYFNVGFSFNEQLSKDEVAGSVGWFKEREKLLIEKEGELFKMISEAGKRLNDKMIERCLMHLQNNYYQPQGINIIESVADRLLSGRKLTSAFEVTALVSRLLRNYRKEEIFEKLVRKYLIDNNNYIVLRGANNPHIIEYENNRNRSLLIHMQKNLTSDRIQEITDYVSPNYLQDLGSLPSISPSELECFEDLPGEEEVIGKIRTVYNPRVQGNKFTFKFDLTDLGEEDIPILALFCKAFPQMGYKTMKKQSYQGLLQSYVGKVEMTHETARDLDGGLKVYAYLTIEFIDRNHEFAFSVLNGLFTDFDHNNLTALSKALHDSATNCFHDVSENLLHYHGIHLAASRSPYAFFESPIYQARTLCAIAADVKKVANPRNYLISLSRKFQEIWSKMMGWSRVELLWECRRQKKQFYHKYLNILLKQIHNQGIKPESIDVSTFPTEKWLKYYPNYDTEMAFEAFAVPYREKNSPAALVLSSLINHSISTFNTLGGCFLFKGALVSFIQGGRQKYLELEDHYKRIDDLDIAKRKIFQSFNRYSVLQQFKSGITFEQARFFKEAVISVERAQVEDILENCLLKQIRSGSSSLLALGPKLQNYQPLLKKGWEIERSIDDVSLAMQSLNKQEVTFKSEKYIDIC